MKISDVPRGKKLAETIASTRLTENEFAKEAGMSPKTVYDLIKNKVASPRADTLEKMAEVLDSVCKHCHQYDPKKRPRR